MSDLQRIESKLDKVIDTQVEQGNRLTAIESDLKHHISRSDKLETIVQKHEQYFWWAIGAIAAAGPLLTLILKLLRLG